MQEKIHEMGKPKDGASKLLWNLKGYVIPQMSSLRRVPKNSKRMHLCYPGNENAAISCQKKNEKSSINNWIYLCKLQAAERMNIISIAVGVAVDVSCSSDVSILYIIKKNCTPIVG